jgi:penicillin-binding protein 1A
MKKFLIKTVGTLLIIGIVGPFIFFAMVYSGFFGPLPTQEQMEHIENIEASIVYDAKSRVLGKYYLQDRREVSLNEINPFLVKALIATEDKRFYQHKGIDARSLGRVLVKSLILQQSAGGGSTITLQLAKNLFPRNDYRFLYYPINKTKEAIIAYRIEKTYSKEEILTLYLNTVSFGEDVYGVESASQRFFNTSAISLKNEQAATLVGMLKATTSYNPALHPEASLNRRNIVFAQMLANEAIDELEYDQLVKTELGVDYKPAKAELAPYFLAQVKQKVDIFLKDYNKKNKTQLNLHTNGLKIYTTLDNGIQKKAEEALSSHMKNLQRTFDKHWTELSMWTKHQSLLDREIKKSANGRSPRDMQLKRTMIAYTTDGAKSLHMSPIDSIKYYLQQLQSGFVGLDPRTGAVKAWVGGIDFQYFPYDHAMIDAKRQVGSTFKPIVYASALENGISPCNYYKADQEAYAVKEGEWVPKNDDASYDGKYTMEGALENSVNTVSVKILNDVGIEPTIKLANAMGIESNIPAVPSIALGTPSISLIEMVTAYASFVNGGIRVNPYTIERIEDTDGNILYEYNAKSTERVMNKKTSQMMVHLLKNVVNDGTAKSIRSSYKLSNDIGGKTGTTQNNADGWFLAITPQLVSGAWVGGIYPEVSFQSTRLGQGATMALPIFARFYQALNRDSAYDNITKAKFTPLPAEWRSELECDPFKEDFKLFDWLFNREEKQANETNKANKEDGEGLFKKIGDIFKKKDKKKQEN